MATRVRIGQLQVDRDLHRFVTDEALPGSGVDPDRFWLGLDSIIHDLAPRNRELLAERSRLQDAIDDFHRSSPGQPSASGYTSFLHEIGYLADEPADFQISTSGVDTEITAQAGPQLVVPLLNARFAVNAANARWGSLYDALYGTDAIENTGALQRGSTYNQARGAAVVARGRAILDAHFTLAQGSHAQATAYVVDGAALRVTTDQGTTGLAEPAQFVGYTGSAGEPDSLVLVHHGLHVEILIDRADAIGAADAAGIKDLLLESAPTTIMDLEDSVAAVDAADKVLGYRNWLLLMQGTLAEAIVKNGRSFTRTMHPDRVYHAPGGGDLTLHGRSLLFIRQVGLLMTTDAVLDRDGNEVPEGILDAMVTALGSVHDLRGNTVARNSRTGSMYVVKPKMHGPAEVAFSCELFSRVEEVLGMPAQTIKMGIMDEERRTSLNLKACISAARDRVAFINTGFLDRTGDEIRTSTFGGPMVRKQDMRSQRWILAYEDSNVDIGLSCGLQGRAQIGKGMWAAPDNMADMLEQKIAHPRAGANCAWVPSPTAATLHATHYLEVDVAERQRQLTGGRRASRADLLVPPISATTDWTPAERQAELDNNIQGVLGYVVRWIDAGIGCSKVPDIHGVALMEDRATCRISSQHVANWLLHGVVSADEVEASLRRMAEVVDQQNAADPDYRAMAPSYRTEAFHAARELVFEAVAQPSGYTEPILHRHRLDYKNANTEKGQS